MVLDFCLAVFLMYLFGVCVERTMISNNVNLLDVAYHSKNYEREQTLAQQEDSFKDGIIWADVGNDL